MTAPGGVHNYAIPMHGEMYYQNSRRDLLFFYCQTPAESGGETLIADGAQAYLRMSEALSGHLLDRRITYQRRRAVSVWRQLYRTQHRDEVVAYCTANGVNAAFDENGYLLTQYTDTVAHHSHWGGERVFVNNLLSFGLQALRHTGIPSSWVTYEDGEPIEPRLLLDAERVVASLTHAVSWRKGDVLIVDNMRMLHGRNGFGDPKRTILLRMGMSPDRM